MRDVLLWGVALFIVISLWPKNHQQSQNATSTSDQQVATAAPLVLGVESAKTKVTAIDTGYSSQKPRLYKQRRTSEDSTYFPDDSEYFEYVRPRDFDDLDTYTYYVTGHGAEGYVTGTIDTRGPYGEGYVRTRDDERVWINTVWTGDSTLEAQDDEGNYYELQIE